jgi:hypothetical protein
MQPVKIGCDEKKAAEECVSVLDSMVLVLILPDTWVHFHFSRFLNATTTKKWSL